MDKRSFAYVMLAALLISTAAVLVYNQRPGVFEKNVAFKVSASELVDAFSNGELQAHARYVGAVIQVEGPVIETINNGNTVVVRMGNGEETMGVSSSLRKDQTTGHLKKGEVITIKGVCNGALMDIVLDNAVMVGEQ